MRSLFVEEVLESKVCELKKAQASEEDLLHFFDYMLKPNESKIVKLFEQWISAMEWREPSWTKIVN